jgi:two-component system response regulator DevR
VHTAEADRIAALTDQERRVLQFIADGLTNRQIAHQMSLSERTVKNYVASVLSKLGMHRRAQAAAFVVRSGLAERRRAQAIGPS